MLGRADATLLSKLLLRQLSMIPLNGPVVDEGILEATPFIEFPKHASEVSVVRILSEL